MELRDRLVVITGASRGIGEALARSFHAAGARVVGIARNAELLGSAMDSAAVGGAAVAVDLSDPGALDGLVDRIENAHGPIDVWVNNAGVDEVGAFAQATAEQVRRIHQINLLAPIELCRQVIARMESRGGGHIVNVSSMAGCAGFSGLTLYCSTKAGLSSFHRVLRSEMRHSSVRSTLVELGPVPTDMLTNVDSSAPTARGFDRFRKIGLLPNVDRDVVASHVVAAVTANRRYVRLPRRAALFPMLSAGPQRFTDLLLR